MGKYLDRISDHNHVPGGNGETLKRRKRGPKLDLDEAERLVRNLSADPRVPHTRDLSVFDREFFVFARSFVPLAVERVRKLEESTHNLDSWINDELLPEIDSLRTRIAELEAKAKEDEAAQEVCRSALHGIVGRTSDLGSEEAARQALIDCAAARTKETNG